jgi:hypothetical protein
MWGKRPLLTGNFNPIKEKFQESLGWNLDPVPLTGSTDRRRFRAIQGGVTSLSFALFVDRCSISMAAQMTTCDLIAVLRPSFVLFFFLAAFYIHCFAFDSL